MLALMQQRDDSENTVAQDRAEMPPLMVPPAMLVPEPLQARPEAEA